MLQSFPGLAPYFCSDCKTRYDSASLLLNHFAKHITQKHACQTHISDGCNDINSQQNCSFLTNDLRKKKSENIFENVLKQALLSQMPRTDPCSPVSSSTSEYCTSSSSSSDNDNIISEQDSEIPLSVVELEKQNLDRSEPATNLMLVKFDLQTRLEDCILKLAAKRDSKMEPMSRSVLNISQDTLASSGLPVINSPDLTVSMASIINNVEPEEFNPLKFCVVTMEEGDDKVDLNTATCEISVEEMCQNEGVTKGSSNRKQLAPKKILFDGKNNQDETINVLGEKIPTKKKYPCLVCCKVFGWSTDLKRHILTHTGERPFKCLQCPATFTRNFLLQKHELKQHRSPTCSGATSKSQTPVLDGTRKLPTTREVASVSGKDIQALHSERKRKLQRTISGQFDSNIIEKRLELHQCSPINIGIFSQQALNIL